MVAMGPGSRRASRRLGRGDAKRRRFSLSDDVRFDKPNNRHDAFKVESLLGYGGYMDLEKSGGPLGLATGRLEKPIKEFQAKNGLKVLQLTSPELNPKFYGFSPTPNPRPAGETDIEVDCHGVSIVEIRKGGAAFDVLLPTQTAR